MIRIFQSSCCFNGFLKGKSSTHSNVKLTVTVRKYTYSQERLTIFTTHDENEICWHWDSLYTCVLCTFLNVLKSTKSSSGYEGEGSKVSTVPHPQS